MADISKIKLPNDNNTYNLADLVARGRIWQGTQAQYDALVQAGTIDPDTVYFVTDGTTIACASNEVTYDHTVSGLSATDVKGALDELADEKMDKANPTGTGSFSLNRKANTTTGAYSTAVGRDCMASGHYSCASGYETTASGHYSHAESDHTTASGHYSHAESDHTTASGYCSHSEGTRTTASGTCAHAEGTKTIANRRSQHVFGEYNIEDTGGSLTSDKGNYIEIVGKGTSDTSRSNARTLDWNGNEVLAGDLTINGNVSLSGLFITGTINSVLTLSESGINYNQQIAETGWYTIKVYSNANSGNCSARFQVGNTTFMYEKGSLGVYDIFIPSPLLLKAGTIIKAMGTFPSSGGADLIRLT